MRNDCSHLSLKHLLIAIGWFSASMSIMARDYATEARKERIRNERLANELAKRSDSADAQGAMVLPNGIGSPNSVGFPSATGSPSTVHVPTAAGALPWPAASTSVTFSLTDLERERRRKVLMDDGSLAVCCWRQSSYVTDLGAAIAAMPYKLLFALSGALMFFRRPCPLAGAILGTWTTCLWLRQFVHLLLPRSDWIGIFGW